MIAVVAPDEGIGGLVLAALRRSVSRSQATAWPASAIAAAPGLMVLVDPADDIGDAVVDWLGRTPHKLMIFGTIPAALRRLFGTGTPSAGLPDSALCRSEPTPPGAFRESPAIIRYTALAEKLGGGLWRRPLQRFDFAAEWNNLGYGAISCDGSIWSLGRSLEVGREDELAAVAADPGGRIGSYAALFDRAGHATLWFNRPVGPIDSFEWRLVETFLSSHRSDELPALPVFSEIPAGHDTLVTMRLDCDEDIESARTLWQAYTDRRVPLSLAIHTNLLADGATIPLISDVAASGGSILSHSATHAPWWGGNREAAFAEAMASADAIERSTGRRPRFAVSPFHQTPHYALEALQAAGYAGCVGGNIAADPAFNLARGGSLAGLPGPFIGHSQQCMLHGDCLLEDGDPLALYREAFDLALASRSIFAYLDHPFSARYEYGWRGEESRIDAHRTLLDHIAATASSPLYLSADAAMDFLGLKARAEVVTVGDGLVVSLPNAPAGAPKLCVEYKGACIAIGDGTRLS